MLDATLGRGRVADLSSVLTMSAARHRSSSGAAIRGKTTVFAKNYAKSA
ncbi:hypothetical protein RSPO_c01480 [Ralstonia solanacearum Po82]|uniref:Uncharacterized protein n=1 Tax=Ralstonia solanacearum (strain Po82) TaxID=1031711 RepID=F6G152_RALS8|nr:hypothetical protein RSPO_c01480 [Ralstonia solanacearum Po82]